jgi:YbbR domain-containing protein
MKLTAPRWLSDNFGTWLLSFILAVTVWVAAVNDQDPVQTGPVSGDVPVEYYQLSDGLLIVEEGPERVAVTIRAPVSVWESLQPGDLLMRADLRGMGPGEHTLELEPVINRTALRVIEFDPAEITITLEESASIQSAVEVQLTGTIPLGYQAGDTTSDPDLVEVSGPVSRVQQVALVVAEVNLSDQREDVRDQVDLIAVDANGELIEGVTIEPAQSAVVVNVHPAEGSKQVVVSPTIQGRDALEAAGFFMAAIEVQPELVTISGEPDVLAEEIQGVVETAPIDISTATEDVTVLVQLVLPDGITLQDGLQTVQVTIRIEPRTGTVTLPVEVQAEGLNAGLFAAFSPDEVQVIVTGPLPLLDVLQEGDVQVSVNLEDLGVGVHAVETEVFVIDGSLTFQNPIPAIIQVTITDTPPPTPTATIPPVN